MKPNLGHLDQLLRSTVGVLLLLSATELIPAIWPDMPLAPLVLVVGGFLIATSLVRFCPIYWLLGVSSDRV
ncbi:YgaP family membrane protein [Tateyamaria omphalii]|uniref:Inner membrane protein YgaP-like transmembrane domain-containing protein n=1 Tax=Tateyamaria omphalii TaxID=299262 RepID=A0A1P8MVJ8_9RHOB|nr:DUF2892 domain-containing protein [Tateyamaria omphalii]APX12022.1 hypothetical protein BWR18_10275 [Tateyamaria omphalii]